MNLKTLGRNQGNTGEHSFDSTLLPCIMRVGLNLEHKNNAIFCSWLFFNGRLRHPVTLKTGCHFSSSAFEVIILNLYGSHQKRARG